jgi:UDPglucose 6-dehydrogenase
MKRNELKIGIFGLWHLGCVYATSLAKLGFEVEASDFDKNILTNLSKGKAPIFEPEMDETIVKFLGKNLNFVDTKKVFKDKDYVFITHDLQVDENDIVCTKLIDQTIELIKKYGESETIFVISSQIPCGTCRRMSKVCKNIIYFPENVRLGKAYETFLKPDRIVLGSDKMELMNIFEKDFGIFGCQFMKMSWESAEMVKHALNSYLATCVSFSSEISDLCELLGANMSDVVAALKTDKRVSPFAPINPGMGFAGATLGRDIKTLKYLGQKRKYKTKLFNVVYQVNSERVGWLVSKIKNKLGSLKGKNVGILGLTYKPGTNTLRRSMSLALTDLLNKEGCKIVAIDPVINEEIDNYGYIKIANNYEIFFDGLDAVVLMTEWPEFKGIDLNMVAKQMKQKFIFDTKNFLNKKEWEDKGFLFVGTGY